MTPRLVKVKILGNNGVQIVKRWGSGKAQRSSIRFEGPAGWLTIPEAAMALDCYAMILYRMAEAKRLRVSRQRGRVVIRVSECLRLRRAWRGRPTAMVGLRDGSR